MAKQILIPRGNGERLMKSLGTTYPTIRAALRYECDSAIARKIRHVAITQYGGVVSMG